MADTSMQAQGGRARAEKLSPQRRREIALKAAGARWDGNRLKPATEADVLRVQAAQLGLQMALRCLTKSGCAKAADKVRRAIASTDGAYRHIKRRARSTTVP